MKLYLINTLGNIVDSISSEYIEDIVEWAIDVYRESYSYQWIDENFKVWETSPMYPQDITHETFKHIC